MQTGSLDNIYVKFWNVYVGIFLGFDSVRERNVYRGLLMPSALVFVL